MRSHMRMQPAASAAAAHALTLPLAPPAPTFLRSWACIPLWAMAEVAIIACDLAEVIGSAVALRLLFGLPLWAGVLITAVDVFVVMLVENRSFRWLEVGIAVLIFGIFGW